jgi:acetolactate synthase I/II/III large subunit
MEAVTKDRKRVILAENIPEIVENAFRTATLPRSGAVFISMPQDVLTETTTVGPGKITPPIIRGAAPQQSLEQAAKLLNNAKQPVLFLGLEASRPDNTAAVRALLKQKPMATIGTYQAAGVVSRELVDCFVGRVGLFKNQPGDVLLDAADVVLTVGFNPVEYDPEIWNKNQKKTIISLDYNPADIHLTYSPDLEIIGNIALNLKQLTPLLMSRDTAHNIPLVQELQKKLNDTIAKGAKISGKKIHPLRFVHDLRANTDDDATIISDIGTHHMWIARYFFCFNPHHLLFSNGQQTLGVALPWAIATSLARPGGKVVSISGDGGFLFSAGELETAVREKANFVHFVWCDGSYDMVKQQQLIKYNRSCSVEFGYVDIVKYAQSFGATGMRINHADEFVSILKKAMAIEGPVLVEVPIDYSDNHKLFKDLETSKQA